MDRHDRIALMAAMFKDRERGLDNAVSTAIKLDEFVAEKLAEEKRDPFAVPKADASAKAEVEEVREDLLRAKGWCVHGDLTHTIMLNIISMALKKLEGVIAFVREEE